MRASIVINREFGSGGREIGRRIAERTGMEFYDSRILQEAAAERGLPADALSAFDERLLASQLFDMTAIGGADAGALTSPYVMYGAIADRITEVARTQPAVFIGRCADHILREAGLDVFSVFVYSTDVAQKSERAVRVDGVPSRDAAKYIARMDKARSRYQQYFTGTHFGDPHEYDLCLNSGRLGYAACTELILAATAD